jgi:hypothetical protein
MRKTIPSSDETLIEAASEYLGLVVLDGTDKEFDRVSERGLQIEAMMTACLARTLSGLRAKAQVLKQMLAPYGKMTDDDEAENRLAWSLATDIERAYEVEQSEVAPRTEGGSDV